MRPFTYVRARSAEEAVAQNQRAHNARYLGGGTNLIDMMKQGIETPDTLIDLRESGLSDIAFRPDGSVCIGTLVTNARLAHDPHIQAHYPVLSEAILAGATPQLRNAATTGGNFLQRTRCWYFREPSVPCNKKAPGTGCPAREGHSTEHAILGGSEHCIAVHPSDMAVALVALDAILHTRSPSGARQLRAEEVHTLPGDTPHIETVLLPNELVTHIELPASSWAARSHYFKTPVDGFAEASAAVGVALQDNFVSAVRIVLGGVGTRPWRVPQAEALLLGQPLEAEGIARVAEAAAQGAEPTPQNAYKVPLLKTVIRYALNNLATRERNHDNH